MALRAIPSRTCVGCRGRAPKPDLIRVVVNDTMSVDGTGGVDGRVVVPDPRAVLPGRGAYLHPDPACVDLAERRRALPRALRVPGPLGLTLVREALETPAAVDRVLGTGGDARASEISE